jgi:hypothetical protein
VVWGGGVAGWVDRADGEWEGCDGGEWAYEYSSEAD